MTIRYPPKTPAYKLMTNDGRKAVYWFVFDAALPGFRDLTGDRPPIKAERVVESEFRVEKVISVAKALDQLDPNIDTGER